MRSFLSFVAGVLFGTGLAVSGMTNPAKVLGFLDVFGAWDPTLALVMGGAVAVAALGFAAAGRMEHPWAAERFAFPTRPDIDGSLVGGAALFGVGWGLVGLCPGPALANLARGSAEAFVFVAAMAAGVLLHRAWAKARELLVAHAAT